MSQQIPTLGSIRRTRQQQQFIGRQNELDAFARNLSFSPDDERRQFVFNVSGQGGVGKSELLKRYRRIAEEQKAKCALTDDLCLEVAAVMSKIAEQLGNDDSTFKEFNDKHRHYKQKRQEIEADPEAPKGLSSLVSKAVVKGGVGLLKGTPLSGVAELINSDALAEQAGQWTEYLAKKLKSHDDVALLREPISVLTPLFLQGLKRVAAVSPVSLFFDTYEQTSVFLDDWLRSLLQERHGSFPGNAVLVIAGQTELDRNKWAEFEILIQRVGLEPFSEDEAKGYLSRRGIIEPQVVQVILSLSNRLPLLIATLASETPSHPEEVGDPSGTAVERFLHWIEDPQQRELAVEAALPRRFDQDVLAVVVGSELSRKHFAWLIERPFVSLQSDHWAYHGVVRPQIIRRTRLQSPQRWAELHGQLADFCGAHADGLSVPEKEQRFNSAWQIAKVEESYHRLCQAPSKNIYAVLELWVRWFAIRPLKSALAKAVSQSGQDTSAPELQNWGARLVAASPDAEESEDEIARIEAALSLFSDLIGCEQIGTDSRKLCFLFRSTANQVLERYDAALEDVEKLLSWQPSKGQKIVLLRRRAVICEAMERYEEAVANYSQAIELAPGRVDLLESRAFCLFRMSEYEKALADFNQVLAISSFNHQVRIWRSVCHWQLDHTVEAIEDVSFALQAEPQSTNALLLRADIYRCEGKYDNAETDYSQALKNEPEKAETYASRGRNRYLNEQSDLALNDFDRAIEIDASHSLAHEWRAELFFARGEFAKSLQDYTNAQMAEPNRMLNNYGLCLSYAGDYAKAVLVLEEELRSDPKSFKTLYNLAVATTRLKGVEAAAPYIENARAALEEVRESDSSLCNYGLGGLDALCGEDEKALEQLRLALLNVPDTQHWAKYDPAWQELRAQLPFQTLLTTSH